MAEVVLSGFEPYMKKIYYLCKGNELSRTDGGFVQFLDAAKAVGVNKLHYDVEDYLNQMKTYYEFVHQQRNDTTHQAPVIEPRDLKPGIHMTVAMYLYATMINITDMEMGGMIDGTANDRTKSQPTSPIHAYEAFDESKQGYSIAAEPGPGENN